MKAFIEKDQALVIWLNERLRKSSVMTEVVRITAVGAIFIPITFAVTNLFTDYAFIEKTGQLIFLEMLVAGSGAWVMNNFIGALYYRRRPYIAFPGVIHRFINLAYTTKSFPSDHTAVAASLATVVAASSVAAGSLLLLIAVSIGLTRMISGVHYPSDVVTGLVVGILAGLTTVNSFI